MRVPLHDWPTAAVLALAVGLPVTLVVAGVYAAPDRIVMLALVAVGWVGLAWFGARLARSPPRDHV